MSKKELTPADAQAICNWIEEQTVKVKWPAIKEACPSVTGKEFSRGAIEAFRVHALWMICGFWARGFRDKRIQGITKRRALELAGEMTGKKYGPKDWSELRHDLEAKWRGILQAASVVSEE